MSPRWDGRLTHVLYLQCRFSIDLLSTMNQSQWMIPGPTTYGDMGSAVPGPMNQNMN